MCKGYLSVRFLCHETFPRLHIYMFFIIGHENVKEDFIVGKVSEPCMVVLFEWNEFKECTPGHTLWRIKSVSESWIKKLKSGVEITKCITYCKRYDKMFAR